MKDDVKKGMLYEVAELIRLCETRLYELEGSIAKCEKVGNKKLMQVSYKLNKDLCSYYKDYYKRILRN
jgi:hypothetical protein